MVRFIRTHLAWKVFLSYVVVVLVGVVVPRIGNPLVSTGQPLTAIWQE